MKRFSDQELEPVVVQRVLNFLNTAQIAADISAISQLHQQLGLDNDYEIGEIVAQRILEKRKSLPDDQFTSLHELNDIKGFGFDKFTSLIQAFRDPEPVKARSFPTVDLFRFTTFRQPEKAIKPAIPFAYIQAPSLAVAPLKAEQLIKDLPSSQELLKEFPALWTFSHWLYEYKAKFSLKDLEEQLHPNLYKVKEAVAIWQILLKEVHLQQDVFLRQACLELLVGHNFLAAYQQAKKEKASYLLNNLNYWRQIAMATVVLPKNLFEGQQVVSHQQLKQNKGNTTQNKQYTQIHKALIASQDIRQHAALKEELSCLYPISKYTVN